MSLRLKKLQSAQPKVSQERMSIRKKAALALVLGLLFQSGSSFVGGDLANALSVTEQGEETIVQGGDELGGEQTEAITIDDFMVHESESYKGIAVDFDLNEDFPDITGMSISLMKDGKPFVTNKATDELLALIATGQNDINTQFIIRKGTLGETNWDQEEYKWTLDDLPDGVRITVIDDESATEYTFEQEFDETDKTLFNKIVRAPADSLKPTFSITSPSDRTVYRLGETVVFAGTVNDETALGSVLVYIDELDNGSMQLLDDLSPLKEREYSFTFEGEALTAGEHRLFIVVTDDARNEVMGETIFVVVDESVNENEPSRPTEPEIAPTPPTPTSPQQNSPPAPSTTTSQQIFENPVVLYYGQDVLETETDMSETDVMNEQIADDVESVLGANDQAGGTPLADTAAVVKPANPLVSLAWYWWAGAIAALTVGWLVLAAVIRRRRGKAA